MELGTKAAVGAGTIPLSSALVSVGLYYLGQTPPQEVVLALQALVSVPVAYIAAYFAPHNAPPQGANP